jgi:hypothetical protein
MGSPSVGTNSNVGMSPIIGKNSGLRPKVGISPYMTKSPTMGKNSGLRPKVGISPYITRSPTMGKSFSNHLPALIAEAIADGLPTAVTEEALVEGSSQPTKGFPEEPLAKGVSISMGSLHPTSAGSEISTANAAATKDISILHLQLVTRAQAKMATKELIPGEELPESLLELIRMHQEQDPYCKQMARQTLHPHQQPNLSLAISGPVRDDSTVQPQSTPGGMHNLLCVARCVIMPKQASLCIELLHQFHDYLMARHWGTHRTLDLLQQHFYWPELEADVKEWVSTCLQCQGKAIHYHQPYGQLEAFEPEDRDYRPFRHISIDWIIGLPESHQRSTGEKMNSILTIVCQSMKTARFIPT